MSNDHAKSLTAGIRRNLSRAAIETRENLMHALEPTRKAVPQQKEMLDDRGIAQPIHPLVTAGRLITALGMRAATVTISMLDTGC